MVMAGGAVSVNVAVRVATLVLPAASRAWTVSMFVPIWRAIPLAVQLVVPAAVPLPPRLFIHVNWVTPTFSAAGPPSAIEPVFLVQVGLEAGEPLATLGGVTPASRTVA